MKQIPRIFLLLVVPALAALVFLFLRQPVFGRHLAVEKGNIREFVSAPGKISSEDEASLSFQTTGKLIYLVKEGDKVKKGQRVAGIDSTELSLSLNRYLDDLRQAEAERAYTYDQVKGHSGDETYAQRQSRTQAEVKYDKAVRNVESARKALKDASLYAPFDGEVVEVNGEINEWVSSFSGQPLIKLIDFSGVHFDAEVDQENAASLKVGQKALVRLGAFPEKEFGGEVYYLSKSTTVSEDGATVIKVKVSLANTSEPLFIGLKGDSEIVIQEKQDVLLIPKNAVYRKGGKTIVHTASGEREIKLGIFDGANWEVLGGLKEGDKVLW